MLTKLSKLLKNMSPRPKELKLTSEMNPQANLQDSFFGSDVKARSHALQPLQGVDNDIQRKHINIISYNIFLRPPFIKNNESDHKDARLKEFIKYLGDYDIICLEEMFGFLNRRKHKLIRYANKAGLLYYADSTPPSFFTSFVVDGGLLVLSRFPVLASEFKPYPYGIFSDSLSQKGVLYSKFQIKEERLHIFQTHMQASYFGENQRYPIITRGDQFKMFRKYLVSCLKKYEWKPGEMVILLGDFNVDARKPLIETSKIHEKHSGKKEYPHLFFGDYFNEYEAMKCILTENSIDELEDLLLKTYNEHPITYGDTLMNDNKEMIPREVVLTDKDDLCSNQSLDYVFNFIPKSLFRNLNLGEDLEKQLISQRKLQIIEGSARVEKFFVDDQEFTQLSDHYGVMVSLQYDNGNDRKSERAESKDEIKMVVDN